MRFRTLRKGTFVYHGTASPTGFLVPGNVDNYAWFSDEHAVAKNFAQASRYGWPGGKAAPRIQKYVVVEHGLRLPYITTNEEWIHFARRVNPFGYDDDDFRGGIDTMELAGNVCAVHHGWWIADNYNPGGDIMLCDPARWVKRVQAKKDRFAGFAAALGALLVGGGR